MITNHTVESLKAFTQDIAETFNRGEIRAPIHLDGGNEEQLLSVFRDIREEDWVLCSWRAQLKCLLKGVPPDELKAAILAGRSISLCFPRHRILSSAIAGGQLPIALGIALGIKRSGGSERVHVFMGDMVGLMGIAFECNNYANWNDLPLRFITEDNGKSVATDTREAWGGQFKGEIELGLKREYYRYTLPWPHSGAGKRINF